MSLTRHNFWEVMEIPFSQFDEIVWIRHAIWLQKWLSVKPKGHYKKSDIQGRPRSSPTICSKNPSLLSYFKAIPGIVRGRTPALLQWEMIWMRVGHFPLVLFWFQLLGLQVMAVSRVPWGNLDVKEILVHETCGLIFRVHEQMQPLQWPLKRCNHNSLCWNGNIKIIWDTVHTTTKLLPLQLTLLFMS